MSAETLRKAAAIVRERGLAKGTYEDAEGHVCAMGALRIAHVGSVHVCPAAGEFWEDRNRLADEIGGPARFSDDSTTTAEDVAAAFEAAADRLDPTEHEAEDDAARYHLPHDPAGRFTPRARPAP